MSRLAEVLAANADKAPVPIKPVTRNNNNTSSSSSANNRPIHPAVLTTIGPGKGGGCSELSCWAYLTRPRPPPSNTTTTNASVGVGDDNNDNNAPLPLPNLVTSQSNSLRVYTVLPNAGTLALTAVYDNLAGTICSLDVIPNGTSSSNSSVDGDGESSCACYDGLLLGFAGHPRLSLVYPSTPMISSGGSSDNNASSSTTTAASSAGNVGQGGVLLASSIIDLTSALIDKSMGGLSYLEQDIIVTVSTGCNSNSDGDNYNGDKNQSGSPTGGVDNEEDYEEDDPCVSVVLGGGVAIASFSLPKGPRPDEDGNSSSSSSSSSTTCKSSWWRVASEPYILPLSTLSTKIRELNGISTATTPASLAATSVPPPGGRKYNPTIAAAAAAGAGPIVSHGFGDIIDITYLSGYTEPTLLILHSNPKRGGGGYGLVDWDGLPRFP